MADAFLSGDRSATGRQPDRALAVDGGGGFGSLLSQVSEADMANRYRFPRLPSSREDGLRYGLAVATAEAGLPRLIGKVRHAEVRVVGPLSGVQANEQYEVRYALDAVSNLEALGTGLLRQAKRAEREAERERMRMLSQSRPAKVRPRITAPVNPVLEAEYARRHPRKSDDD